MTGSYKSGKHMKFSFVFIHLFFSFFILSLSSCALLDSALDEDLVAKREDRFKASTGHELFKIYSKDDRLGYIYENGSFVKKVWGGKKIVSPSGQTIKLLYTRESFDKLKLFLGDDLSVGPGLENVHHFKVYLESVEKHELVDFQPLIEYMGENNIPTLEKPFIVSMIKVAKFSVEAYQKFNGDFGVEYRPYPLVKIKGSTGSGTKKSEEQTAYNIFVGYKTFEGQEWVNDFEAMPKVQLNIAQPENDEIIDRVRVRVRGAIEDYSLLSDVQKNQMQLYIMTRNEYEDDWLLQSKTTIDTEGFFEGIVKLGDLEKGNGHRYSIAVFVTYFKINRKVNSVIPILPFNKGKDIIYVKREDNF